MQRNSFQVDSHNRLVELQHLPWSNHCVYRVLASGRAKDLCNRVAMDTIPRLSYLLQRALVRVARETQRLARNIGLASKNEVSSALNITLCPTLADSSIKVPSFSCGIGHCELLGYCA